MLIYKKFFAAVIFCLGLTSMGWGAAWAQVCAAPGKDGAAVLSGILNTYYPGNGTLPTLATSLVLGGPSVGAAGTVTVGDKLLIIQLQAASIDTSDDERYGDGTGTAAAKPDSTASQANGYTALNQAGFFEYVSVTAANGNNITFTPALTNNYAQNTASQPRLTYQVIRVPQYASATINGASPVTAAAWNGTTGGVMVADVAGIMTFSGAGPHINVSNVGFRGGAQGVANSTYPAVIAPNYRSFLTSDGGGKGEGIAGTPPWVNNSQLGTYNNGTRFSDVAGAQLNITTTTAGYANGNFMRGAPGNAGGGGNTHNAAGGGGGNGGQGGVGGQTFNGDGLRDLGGYGGSQTPQDGILLATRMFMGGGGGSGSLNNGSATWGLGGQGGGVVMLRVGAFSGAGLLRADGQRGWDSNVSNDAGGGGGAGGSVFVIAGSGHGNISVQARGGDGADSNLTNGSLAAFTPPFGNQGGCCDGEREGPGGGGGGGAVYANASLGILSLGGGINGLSREDKRAGFSGNMRATPGAVGTSNLALAASAVVGVREGYICKPVLSVTKRTGTPSRSVPADTTGTYQVGISNAANSGWAYGVALIDALPAPFTLGAPGTATLAYSGSATYSASQPASTAAFALSPATWGQEGLYSAAFNLAPGASVTLSYSVTLNSAASGTYQNAAQVRYTDPTRSSGGPATSTTANPTVTPGGTDASGAAVGGSNYVASSSTQEDIVISGVAGTSADLSLVKTGPATAFVGDTVNYSLVINNSGPSNITGGASITDNVPANIGSVTWACTLTGGVGDCDTLVAGPGVSGSGNAIVLTRAALSSGAQLSIAITGVVLSAGNTTNTATVAVPAGFTDPTPSNNTGTATSVFALPTADLAITKTNGTTTVPQGGVASHIITVTNNGPAPVSNAVVTDPAGAGMVKLSMTCSASGGASCPGSFSTTTFETPGLTIPSFPVGGIVVFNLTSQITGTPTVTNTAFITSSIADPTPTNNSASDTDTVVVNRTQVVSAAAICPAGTTEQLTNLLSNSDFANTIALVGTSQNQYAPGVASAATGVSVQTGAVNYSAGAVVQNPFPGDAARGIANANNWVYSKGNSTGAAWRLWRQNVTGLVPNRSYEFLYYYSSPVAVGQTTTVQSQPQIQVTSGTNTYALSTVTAPFDTGTDTWRITQSTFVATTTAVTLALIDLATTTPGDDLAFTQLILRECKPNADPSVAKTDGISSINVFGTSNYTVTVANNNASAPGPADGVAVRDAAATGLTKNSIVCSAAGGAVCPPSSTIAGIESAGGLTIPALPFNSTVQFAIVATTTLLNGSVTNTAALILPPGLVDANLANNSASDINLVVGAANISISKTNNTSTVAGGGSVTYTLTVGNAGPSAADGAVLRDAAVPGLVCTDVVCSSASGMVCPALAGTAAARITDIQSGLVINPFPPLGSLIFSLSCGVVATGQ